jgi:hypothetical protein
MKLIIGSGFPGCKAKKGSGLGVEVEGNGIEASTGRVSVGISGVMGVSVSRVSLGVSIAGSVGNPGTVGVIVPYTGKEVPVAVAPGISVGGPEMKPRTSHAEAASNNRTKLKRPSIFFFWNISSPPEDLPG